MTINVAEINGFLKIKYSDNGCYLYNISTSGGKSKRMFGNSKAYIESIKIYSDYIYFNYAS